MDFNNTLHLEDPDLSSGEISIEMVNRLINHFPDDLSHFRTVIEELNSGEFRPHDKNEPDAIAGTFKVSDKGVQYYTDGAFTSWKRTDQTLEVTLCIHEGRSNVDLLTTPSLICQYNFETNEFISLYTRRVKLSESVQGSEVVEVNNSKDYRRIFIVRDDYARQNRNVLVMSNEGSYLEEDIIEKDSRNGRNIVTNRRYSIADKVDIFKDPSEIFQRLKSEGNIVTSKAFVPDPESPYPDELHYTNEAIHLEIDIKWVMWGMFNQNGPDPQFTQIRLMEKNPLTQSITILTGEEEILIEDIISEEDTTIGKIRYPKRNLELEVRFEFPFLISGVQIRDIQ